MAKKSMIERNKKRQNLFLKYKHTRYLLKNTIKTSESFTTTLKNQKKLQSLPLNSMQIRLRNRCFVTGRPRGFYRNFGLSRNFLRKLGNMGIIPGLKKASW